MLDALHWVLNDAPFWLAFAFFFCGAMLRGNATYWVGRGIARGVEHTRFQKHLEGRLYRRAQRLIARWGVLAVPLSFLTVGVQSAVNASAGISRMPLKRYLPAVTAGALLWAGIYATVGMAVFYTWVALDWPWLLAGAVALATGLLAASAWRRARARQNTEAADPAKEP